MDMSKNKILVADDEKEILEILRLLLTGEGYEVITAQNGQEVLEQADDTIDLYILDVNMPVMTGFVAGAELRKKYDAPIIFLTAYSGESDKVMGFSIGADDYIVKPFSNLELLLRVRALFRRMEGRSRKKVEEDQVEEKNPSEIQFKDLILDLDNQSIRKNGEVIVLTYTEFKILELFITHPKKIYSLENIYQSIWEEEAVGDSTIMVHIKNIRKKIGDNSRNPIYIKTAWGKGYYVD
ncbi:MAG TPA: response regulator transcription factor [Candidatus Scybalomonas excrementigallinarum]|nr:response regulator transcription factor [Candidatus Scybalomonas excrementigallinarum]